MLFLFTLEFKMSELEAIPKTLDGIELRIGLSVVGGYSDWHRQRRVCGWTDTVVLLDDGQTESINKLVASWKGYRARQLEYCDKLIANSHANIAFYAHNRDRYLATSETEEPENFQKWSTDVGME
jgi:hypothetical protein